MQVWELGYTSVGPQTDALILLITVRLPVDFDILTYRYVANYSYLGFFFNTAI